METIMFLLLLNLFKKIKIIKEKSLFKQKTINCKYYNLTGMACTIFEIEKKNYNFYNYFFLKKNEKSKNKEKYNNFKFIMNFIKIISDIFSKILFLLKINYKCIFISFNICFKKIFSFLNICYLVNLFNFFSFIDGNKIYIERLLLLEKKIFSLIGIIIIFFYIKNIINLFNFNITKLY